MSVRAVYMFPVRDGEPYVLSDGKSYLHFGAFLYIGTPLEIVDGIVSAIEGADLPQYDGVLIEGQEGSDLLRWVSARSLKSLATHKCVQQSQHNRAVWAYLSVLSDDDPVAMYQWVTE